VGVENHGVDPDIEVEDQPADLLAGHDAQLEAGVDVLMKQIGREARRLSAGAGCCRRIRPVESWRRNLDANAE